MKFFYTAILFVFLGAYTATAQLPDYSVAPDWTAVDIDGNQHNLYSMLDSGYAVAIDLSAAWCGPCWTIHQNGLFQDLHDMYGAEGTNEMRVFYIESESTNSIDQLYGIGTSGGGGNRATDTQGDWVTGHTFPFIDDASIANQYALTAYPTSVVIGTDRLTRSFVGSPGPSVALVHEIAQSGGGPAVQGTDARLLAYNGQSLSLCGAFTPSVLIQNHGTDVLTSVDFSVMGDGTELATGQWTGNLPSYNTTTVTLPEVNGTGYNEVTVNITNVDADDSNNSIEIAGLTLLQPNTSGNMWDVENADPQSFDLPDGISADPSADFEMFAVNATSFSNPPGPVGGFGNSDFSLLVDFYDNQNGSCITYLDKIDMTNVGDNPTLNFNHTYRQYTSENDRLIIAASDDCGATWTNIFDAAGSSLSTVAASQNFYVPGAGDWQENMIDLSTFSNASELIVRFTGITAYGNNLYIDDIAIEGVVGVAEIPTIESTQLYPNPTSGQSVLEINVVQNEDVNVFVVDQLGRTVQNVFSGSLLPGKNTVEIDAANLADGIYSVVIRELNGNKVNSMSLQINK